MNSVELHLEAKPAPDVVRAVLQGLVAYNVERTKDDRVRELVVSARDEQGEIVGGLLGEIAWGWLSIQVMWIEESHRRRGLGSKLLAFAEAEARSDGCHDALLDTFSFQAPRFYLRHGYLVFGELEDYPQGHRRYFLRKRLGAAE